ncbi:MAG: hypothetical protein LBV48_02280 [Mycoplasmataceae bacterium]|jgi:hypothetical protein|nr:hypothetical protein [Mycoplasmataceae bacterium]
MAKKTKSNISISSTDQLSTKLQADKQIKILNVTTKYETQKDILSEKYHMSLASLQTKLNEGLSSLEAEYQDEVEAIDEKYN